MKYECIEFEAYESMKSLGQYIDKVLKGFGEKYVINFAYSVSVPGEVQKRCNDYDV